ncbi:MAG: DUF4388 domain-containing protein [Myxococcota bacterium]
MERANESILIADAEAARAERIARAFEGVGRGVRIASNGASALEIALSAPPRLIVVHAELPFVDAAKLAEILRANPRTRGVGLLVLGRASRRAALAGVGDEWVDEASAVDAILGAAARLLERQARLDRIALGAHDASVLEGSLVDLRPVDLLHRLHQFRATGLLRITPAQGSAAASAEVRIAAGEIQGAELGSVCGEKALYRLLAWSAGSFRFEPGPVDGATSIKLPTRSLLAEGQRQLDEWHRLAPRLPSLDAPVRLRVARDALPPVLHPLTQEVLGRIEQAGRVADVIEQCSQPDYQVLRTLHTLAERGIIEFGRTRVPAPDSIAHALFSEAQVRRLRGFVQVERRSGEVLPNAKLLVVAESGAAVGRFMGLVAKVPGAELAPGSRREGDLPTRGDRALATLGRIAVDKDLSIDLVHLPADPAFAPLRAFAAHRALGVIVLHDAHVDAEASKLAGGSETGAGQPPGRSFHVVLLDARDRISPDELRQNLALLESASLFLLPLDPAKDPGSLLRSLFARIVP